jgi:hypothetical protein
MELNDYRIGKIIIGILVFIIPIIVGALSDKK